ncbi:MAG: AAA family ATPase [Mycoplasmoidaceae bacterium]
MIFLKNFYAKGFKSYADNVSLNFEESMIGIVGPNGAGKSNIIDAIKWVLGEKSHKALRGKKSDDIIFHGSATKKGSDFAEVTLTFDNKSRILYSDLDEISVTRRLQRGSGTNKYFINGEEVRLKDIQDVFLDTGLSKGSLGIISQGTVNWFADAKAEERKKIFEEAAGIGRYTKKKEESIRQLDRAQNNFNRVSDLVKELARDLKRLEGQVDKVKKYAALKEELTNLELNILSKDIIFAKDKLLDLSNKLSDLKKRNSAFNFNTDRLEQERTLFSENLNKIDEAISTRNKDLSDLSLEINKLEIRKSAFDTSLEKGMESQDLNQRTNSILNLIKNIENELKNKIPLLDVNQKECDELKEEFLRIDNRKSEIQESYMALNSELSAKTTHLNNLIELSESNAFLSQGSKSIIENKNALDGIHVTIGQAIKIDPLYEKAISSALGNNINNIIVNTNKNAQRAIDFLKKNHAGSATFMPIYNLTPRYINADKVEIASQIAGYINIAANLVKYDNKLFKTPIDALLARTIIVENLQAALEVSKFTGQSFKVISLDGEIVFPGGIIKGGYVHTNKNLLMMNFEAKQTRLKNEIENINKNIIAIKLDLETLILNSSELNSKINEKSINISKYKEFIEDNEKNLERYKSEYQKISNKSYDGSALVSNNEYDNIMKQINLLYLNRERIYTDLRINEDQRKIIRTKLNEIDLAIKDARSEMDKNTNFIIEYEVEEVRCKAILDNAREKINANYKMSIDYVIEKYNTKLSMTDIQARERIKYLYKSIDYLGPMNMDAINELKEKQARYDQLFKELTEAESARNNILEVIQESDAKAVIDYENTIRKINDELPLIFKYLFGGGSCAIEFVDSENVLESGIDILASPPGKKINSLFALSGGEKTLVALSVLFAILKTSHFPLVILDEAESALDPANVERFGNIISKFANETQFIIITHRPGTMEKCESLYGATMATKGVTTMYRVQLAEAERLGATEEAGI